MSKRVIWKGLSEERAVAQFLGLLDRPLEGCWRWLGSVTGAGYGQPQLLGEGLAHRVAYRLFVGPIPEGKQVLHRCDNPPCCRPDHLFLGTALDNMRDMIAKGRARHPPILGSRNGFAKLTEQGVIQMRAARALFGLTYRQLGSAFGVSASTACSAVSGLRWGHV